MTYLAQRPTLRTLQQAIVYFDDPIKAQAYMIRLRWPDGKVTCPACGSTDVVWMPTRSLFQCKRNHLKRQFSVKVGTIMEASPIPLGKWMLVTWMLMNCRNGISSHEIGRTIGVTQKSAWFMLHRLRYAMLDESAGKLTGEVEADETYVGGRSRNMHLAKRGLRIHSGGVHDKTPVLGILERQGKVRAMVVRNHRRPELHGAIRRHVTPGSILYTDDLHSYRGLADYYHAFVDHATSYVRGRVHTNGLENFWSLLKRALKGTYISVTPEHLNAYVAEQVCRFNHRKNHTEEQRFQVVLNGMPGKRLTYKQLIGVIG